MEGGRPARLRGLSSTSGRNRQGKKMGYRTGIIATVLLFICTVLTPGSAEAGSAAPSGYRLTAGVSVKEVTFQYFRSENDSSPAGEMTEGMDLTYVLRAESPYFMGKKGKFGYYLEFGLSGFSMSKQNVDLEEKELGTSMKGRFFYITPVSFFPIYGFENQNDSLSILGGAGLGIGYLDAKGEMILTEDGSGERHVVDVGGFGIAVSILLEFRYGRWMSRIYGGGPFLDRRGSTYSIFGFSWDFGYSFVF